MRMRSLLLVIAALLMPAVASAQPAALSDYLWMVGPPPPGQNIHIPSVMGIWCDDTVLIAATPPLAQACTPRVTSKYYPFPTSATPNAAPASGSQPVLGSALASSLVLKAAPGNLYDASATSTAAGDLVLINATAAPSSGSSIAPVDCQPVPANGQGGIVYPDIPEVFTIGVVALFTTGGCLTYTPSTAAFLRGRVK